MIRKVKTVDLKIGAFIHDFNCESRKDTLFIDQALIKSQKLIDIISSWGIEEVYIDTERGIDVTDSESFVETRQQTDQKIERIAQENQIVPEQVPLREEIAEAAIIRNEAVSLIQNSLELASEGKPPEVGPSYDLVSKMKDSIKRNKDALILLMRIRRKDEYTLYHSISVSSLVLDMCNFSRIPCDQSLNLAVGALFHDIGKTLVPKAILNKPGKLTEYESLQMRKHSEYSANLLRDAEGLPMEAYDISLHHHERYDGTGYPHGLQGDHISYGAQLTSVCDIFDAITSARCYRAGLGTVAGLRKVYEMAGTFFLPKLAHDFIRCIGVYPVGSCVRLQNGLIGVVIGSTDSMLQPVVKVIFDNKKKKKLEPYQLDLAKTNGTIESYEEPRKLGLKPAELLQEMVA
jgi:putative nucleotidyltransferase with HDIG domain